MLLMKAVQLEKDAKKRKRLTISQTLEQSSEDCPNAEGKPVKTRLEYCATKCADGQKPKELGVQITAMEETENEWTFEEDLYLVRNYPFHTTKELAEKIKKPFDEIITRFKYITAKAETATGSESNDLRS